MDVVTDDSVYGSDGTLRRCIETSGRGYVLAVTSAQRPGGKPVADWLADVPAEAWRRLSAGDGAEGPRLYDRAWLPDRAATALGWQKGLLIRRKIAKPDELTFYLTLAPAAAGLSDLARVAGTRWTIEGCFDASGVGPRCIQGRGRPRPRRGALLDRLAPPRHAGPAGRRPSDRRAPGGRRGAARRSTSGPSCCP